MGSALRSGGRRGLGRRGLGRGGGSALGRGAAPVSAGGTGAAARALAATLTTTAGAAAAAGYAGTRRGLRLTLGAGARDLALVDPDLDADAAEGRLGLVEAVVDVGAERVQGHAALAVELGARHLGAVETTRALDPDALGTRAHRGLHGLAHRTTELHATGELLGDTLGDQLSVDLGVLDLEDVQLDLLAGELLELAADAVGLGATATDHDAGTRGVDVHPHAVRSEERRVGKECRARWV